MLNETEFEIKGQKEAAEQLYKIYKSNKIPHALLFDGLPGCGKFETAVKFGALLNSGSENDKSAKIFQLREPYFNIIMPLPRGRGETPDDNPTEKLDSDTLELIQSEMGKKANNPYHTINIPKANNIKINSIRELKKNIAFNYDDIPKRIYYFQDAHLMSEEAQNSFLKSLEEPPEGILFILSTPYKEKLLTTIHSRCWQVNFKPLLQNDIVRVLTDNFSIDKEKAGSVSYFADGSVEKAVKLLELDFEELLNNVINIIRYSLAGKMSVVWELLTPYLKDNPVEFSHLILELIKKWLLDVISDKNSGNIIYFVKYEETVKKFNIRYAEVNIYEEISELDRLDGYLDSNVNLNVLWLNIIFELASIGKRLKLV